MAFYMGNRCQKNPTFRGPITPPKIWWGPTLNESNPNRFRIQPKYLRIYMNALNLGQTSVESLGMVDIFLHQLY